MNARKSLCVAVGVLIFPLSVLAVDLALQPGSVVSFDGDSTLHPFSAKSEQLGAKTEVDTKATNPASDVLHSAALKQFELTIPVESLKSKETKLDKNMYKALNAAECPDIRFKMSGYEVQGTTVHAKGTLQIACKEQPVVLEGVAETTNNVLMVHGKYPLKMTGYGVKPPTMMMGAIKVKDDVVVRYDLKFSGVAGK
jgi:polyisoprenoid-binding protein YceI